MQLNKPIFTVFTSLGCIIGIITKNIGLWLPIFLAIGLVLGKRLNKK
jgi:hypothetical protein